MRTKAFMDRSRPDRVRVRQNAFTFLAPVPSGKAEELTAFLNGIGETVNDQDILPFARITTLHFARFVVIETVDSSGRHCHLLFTSNFDGPVSLHLEEWVAVAEGGLHRVLNYCEGYPDTGLSVAEDIKRFLRAHALSSQTFYVGAVGLAAERICREARVWQELQEYLDARQPRLLHLVPVVEPAGRDLRRLL